MVAAARNKERRCIGYGKRVNGMSMVGKRLSLIRYGETAAHSSASLGEAPEPTKREAKHSPKATRDEASGSSTKAAPMCWVSRAKKACHAATVSSSASIFFVVASIADRAWASEPLVNVAQRSAISCSYRTRLPGSARSSSALPGAPRDRLAASSA